MFGCPEWSAAVVCSIKRKMFREYWSLDELDSKKKEEILECLDTDYAMV